MLDRGLDGMLNAGRNRAKKMARGTTSCHESWKLVRIATVMGLGLTLASCMSSPADKADINNKTKFSESKYGVSASKRVTTSKNVKKGGGTYKIGKPYMVNGRWYHPKEEPGYDKVGLASWYGPNFHGRHTANGEVYDQYHLSAAHPTFPLPSYARVTNVENGTSVVVRVNDRGPFAHGRIIDVSSKAADMLKIKNAGVAKVRVEYMGKARMDGRDMPYLMASYRDGSSTNMIASAGDKITDGLSRLSPPALISKASTKLGFTNENLEVASADTGKGPRLVSSDQFYLPEIGPIPRDRPIMGLASSEDKPKLVNAYRDERYGSRTEDPFAALIKEEGQLTEEAILAFAEKQDNL